MGKSVFEVHSKCITIYEYFLLAVFLFLKLAILKVSHFKFFIGTIFCTFERPRSKEKIVLKVCPEFQQSIFFNATMELYAKLLLIAYSKVPSLKFLSALLFFVYFRGQRTRKKVRKVCPQSGIFFTNKRKLSVESLIYRIDFLFKIFIA